MLVLEFLNIVCPSVIFSKIAIHVGTGEVTKTLHPLLLNLGEFVMGNDNPDDDMIMFPSNVSIEFQFGVAETFSGGVFTPSVLEADNGFYETLEQIRSGGASVYVFKEGAAEPYFTGSFEDDLIRANASARKISLIFYDDYRSLRDANPGYFTSTKLERHSLEYFIKLLLPGISEINYQTDMRFKYKVDENPAHDSICSIDQTGLMNMIVFNETFGTKGEILKALLNTFASYGIIGFNKTFYFMPRYYDGRSVEVISKESLEETSEVEFDKIYRGFISRRGFIKISEAGIPVSYDFKIYKDGVVRADLDKNPSVYSIYVLASAGNEDNENGSSMLLYKVNADGSSDNIKAGSVSYRTAGGSYSEERSLGDWVHSLIYDNIKNKGRRFRASLPGLNYSFQNFYSIEGISGIYRALQLRYDSQSDITRVVLKEVLNQDVYINPSAVTFNKLLRSFNLKLYINRKAGWEEYSGSSNVIYYSGEQLMLEWDNPYNCGKTQAIEFDAAEINIPNEELSVWIDNFTIPVYIGIGNTRQTASMASEYPVSNDANGRWYLIAELPDMKNQNPLARIEYYMKGIRETHPFWFWVGIKSSTAKLFDNIAVYNPVLTADKSGK